MTLSSPEMLQAIAARIDADFAPVNYPGLTFLRYRDWVAADGLPDAGGEDPDMPVCRSGGHSFALSLADGAAAALVAVADALADDVMDELHRPWPEVRGPSGESLVLEAAVDDTGTAVWSSSDGTVRCPSVNCTPAWVPWPDPVEE